MRLLSLLPRLVRRAVAAGGERLERSTMGLDSELPCDAAAQPGVDLDLSDPQQAWSATTDFDVRALDAPLEEPAPPGEVDVTTGGRVMGESRSTAGAPAALALD